MYLTESRKMKLIKQIAEKEIEKFRTPFSFLFIFGQSSFRVFHNVVIKLQGIIKRKIFWLVIEISKNMKFKKSLKEMTSTEIFYFLGTILLPNNKHLAIKDSPKLFNNLCINVDYWGRWHFKGWQSINIFSYFYYSLNNIFLRIGKLRTPF